MCMKTSGTLQETIEEFHKCHEKTKQLFDDPKASDFEYSLSWFNTVRALCNVIARVYE